MPPIPPHDAAGLPVKILVVEDVANVADVLKARLESFAYQVCAVAATGPEAIAGALRCRPDLVLMDILLAGDMNGIEAAEQINRHMDVPIVYLSCLTDDRVLDRAIHTNPYGFIVKPYDSAELHFCIENALIKHRAAKKRDERIAELEKRLPGTK